MRNVTACGVVVVLALAGVGLVVSGGATSAAEVLKAALENQAKAVTVRGTTTVTVTDPPPGTPAKTTMTFYGEGNKARFEFEQAVSMTDGKRIVVLNKATKVATSMPLPSGPGGMPDFAKEMAANVLKSISAAGGKDKVTPVAAATIGGAARPGFKVTGLEYFGQKCDVTYWLDAEQKLPLRFEMTKTGPPAATNTTDLVYGEKLDPKLFDLTVPADYKQEELKLPAVPNAPGVPNLPPRTPVPATPAPPPPKP